MTTVSPTPSSASSFSLISGISPRDALSPTYCSDEDEIVLARPLKRSPPRSTLADDDDFIVISSSLDRRQSVQNRHDHHVPNLDFGRLAIRDDEDSEEVSLHPPSTRSPSPRLIEAVNVPTKTTVLGCVDATVVTPVDTLRSTAPHNPASTTPTPKVIRPRGRNSKRNVTSYPSPSPSPPRRGAKAHRTDPLTSATVAPASKPRYDGTPSKKHHSSKETQLHGLGQRGLVDDLSDDESDHPLHVPSYQDAVDLITSFLADPVPLYSTAARLNLLRALIIELGLLPPVWTALPSTLTAAKAFLKAKAHINVKDYLKCRGQGLEQLQSCMFRSRKELVDDLRSGRNRRAKVGWIKRRGLHAFLVSFL